MKIILSEPIKEIHLTPEQLISELSMNSDSSQAEFINIFAAALSKNVEGETNFSGLQTCSIAEKLDKKGREFIKGLSEFIEIQEEISTI